MIKKERKAGCIKIIKVNKYKGAQKIQENKTNTTFTMRVFE